MVMSEAAQYWGIPNPIGKRDRASGAKKRKQEDIERLFLSIEATKND
jgi:DNA (cytosine-5)-methyltransferase 1